MHIGLSTYSLEPLLRSGALSLEDVIDRAAGMGAEVLELVPFSFRFDDPDTGKIDLGLIRKTLRRAKDAGIRISNYAVSGNLLQEGEPLEAEIRGVCREADVAAELGLPVMRHDVGGFAPPHAQYTREFLDFVLPHVVEAVSRISLYAKERGVTTLLENHGFLFNGLEPVTRLLDSVMTGSYGLLLDTGNAACVDEDPMVMVRALAGRCRMAHLKDFYIGSRLPAGEVPEGSHWFTSRGGEKLRGAVLGRGHLDVRGSIRALKQAGYDGDVSIEFEGREEPLAACAESLRFALEALAEA